MTYTCPEDWRPRGIDDLEPNAWRALRHVGSTSVVAGPGAGKTEFLAQRAAYLLETGICRAPYRVLAISFKSDAAHNLAERVQKRCPPELAYRFTSLTFDAFTKGLVDRFVMAVPADWRPTLPYEVILPKPRQMSDFITGSIHSAPPQWQAEIAGIDSKTFEANIVGAYKLPQTWPEPQSGKEFAILRWWTSLLRRQRSTLTFVGLNRLSELLLRSHPHILRALRVTYPFVFVDEFQDTTYAQYGFLLSAFSGGDVTVTAVGDDKQRIMTWAGARVDAFERFSADFAATRIPLTYNFRSSPDLVRIQHVVALAIDQQVAPSASQAARMVDGDVAQVWNCPTIEGESAHLAQWITADMAARGSKPRDYAILVKQKSDDFETDLAPVFAQSGLRLRNESHALGRTTLQDLLSDEFTKIAIALLRLGATHRAPTSWQCCSSALLDIRNAGFTGELAAERCETELIEFITALRADMEQSPPTVASAATLSTRVMTFLDLTTIARTYLEYSSGELLAIMVEAFQLHLTASVEGATTWGECLDAFEGLNHIPLMTVHKSKGLEYDTIIFVGLDDRAWWAHSPGNAEGLSTFFVALSRAKQRAIFAFCQERGPRRVVAELFQLLTDAGVPEIDI